MRGWLVGLACSSLVGVGACSEEDAPDTRETVGASTPTAGAGAGGTGSVASGGAAGSAGSGSSAAGAAAGGTGSASEGSEGNPDPTGIVGQAGSNDGSGPASAGGPARPDAGPAVVAAARCPAGPFADSPLPGGVAPQPQMLCGGMTFTEGAVWFAERNTLFFSDFQLNNPAVGRIMSFTPGGQCQELIANAGTNGLVIAPDGNLLGARHSDQTLTLFDLETQQPTVLVADNAGLAFNSPNDIAVRSDGNLYFTDPDFLLGNRVSEQPTRTYRRDPSGVLSVINENSTPNGITLSPDESRLYVSQFGNGASIVVYDVDGSGAVSNEQTFIGDRGSDGMAIDCAGNLYITQQGVQVFSPAGDLIGTIAAPGAANVAFGGPDRQTLFITATTSLLAVELAIPGLPY